MHLTEKQLIKAVAKRKKYRQIDAIEIVKGTFETIMDTVSKGQFVAIKGFGSFHPIFRKERLHNNVATGKFEMAKARIGIKFLPARAFKDQVNGINSGMTYVDDEEETQDE